MSSSEKNANKTRLFWMGVDGNMEALNDLESRVTGIVNEHAIIPDRKPPKPWETFTPHITIARVAMNAKSKTRVAVYEEVHSLEQINHDPFLVNDVALFETVTSQNGPSYVPIVTFPLNSDDTSSS